MSKSDFQDFLSNPPVVIDNGSGVMKCGCAGLDKPSVVFPSFVGRPKHRRVMAGALEGDLFVGNRAEELRGLLSLQYPINHGIIENWNDMEMLWTNVFSELRLTPEEHPVLLTEAPLNPQCNREAMAEVFFETFAAPAIFVSAQAILSLYAGGKTSGVVLDSGDGVTHAVPVYEGFAISHAISRADVAGRDITHYLALLLRRAGHIFHTTAEMEVVRSIKEETCYVAFSSQKDDTQDYAKSTAEVPFLLPDGSHLQVGGERFRAPEILFNPSLIGLEYPGIHEVLVSAISRTDLDLRKTLYSQIVLSGGSTLYVGFGDRLLNEVRRLAPKDIKIRISAPPERRLSTWIGGSILASLASFKKMWITKKEYEEDGVVILHKKTF